MAENIPIQSSISLGLVSAFPRTSGFSVRTSGGLKCASISFSAVIQITYRKASSKLVWHILLYRSDHNLSPSHLCPQEENIIVWLFGSKREVVSQEPFGNFPEYSHQVCMRVGVWVHVCVCAFKVIFPVVASEKGA